VGSTDPTLFGLDRSPRQTGRRRELDPATCLDHRSRDRCGPAPRHVRHDPPDRRAKDPLLVGGSKDGGLASIDPRTGAVTRLLDSSPAIDATVDAIGSGMWATTGIRAIATTGLVGPGVPTHELRFDPFERTQPERRFRLPEAVRNIALGHSEMWLGREGALVALPLPVGAQPAGVWRPPKDHDIAACDPDARIAIVTTRLMDEDAAMMTAFELR
jgi:hypothetical protein